MKERKTILDQVKLIAELNKIKITSLVAVTTVTGYILAKKNLDMHIVLPSLGIFLMACGSSALNHLQEWRTDIFMQRTQKRPLPQGKITKPNAVVIIIIESLLGFSILFLSSGLISAILGLTALFWYNGIYTPLKKYTANAVIPGSVIGSIPPLVGWVAAGGSLLSPHAWTIAAFFFVWQVPHFYLLAYKYADQYKNAGFPSIKDKYSEITLRRLLYIWILATSIATIFLQIVGLISSIISSLLLLVSVLWLNSRFLVLMIKNTVPLRPGKYFMNINYFVLSVIIILSVDHLLF